MSSSVVDHKPPITFSVIVKFFLQDNTDVILSEELFQSGEISGTSTVFADESLSQRFMAYHNSVCELRVVQASANASISHLARITRGVNSI